MKYELLTVGKKRLKIVSVIIIGLVVIIAGRLFKLQILDADIYKKKLNAQRARTIPLSARRGNIYDKNHNLLATTRDSYSVYVLQREIKDDLRVARILSTVLDIPLERIMDKIKREVNFIWIERKIIDKAKISKIKKIKISGIHYLKEQKRYYLRGTTASHVLGYVDYDNKGKGGVELFYDDYLQGIDGKMIYDIDPKGNTLYSGSKIIQKPKNGYDLHLTIDEFIQYTCRKSLAKTYSENNADSASAIVMNVKTGAVLAMVSLPDYNPNYYYTYPMRSLRNSNIQTVYEPGSTFKIFTVAAALSSGVLTTDSKFQNGNILKYGGEIIREAHSIKHPNSLRYVRNIVIESLNIGAAKMAIKTGKETIDKYIKMFGFGSQTGIDLPGESGGLLRALDKWQKIDLATIAFGQGIAVTPIQLITAVSCIANDGKKSNPRVVDSIYNDNGELVKKITGLSTKIIDKNVSWEIRKMMRDVVNVGTGTNARVAGYDICGKTGTSQKAGKGQRGYVKGRYVSSFVGYFPLQDPLYSILVVVDNPKKKYYYGGTIAAPVFREIAEEIIRYFSIPPIR